MSSEKIERKIAVIFATDVVGYSKHMETDESQTVQNLRACEKILNKFFDEYDARLFNTGGDSFLAEFPSAVSAVECAVAFQKAIQERNSSEETTIKLEFRVGINSGDVIKEKNNLLGDGVNIAARLEALAQVNGITISKGVYDFVKGKTKFEFNDLGIQKVKQNEFHAFDLILNNSQKRTIKNKSSKSKFVFTAALISILAVGLSSYFFINQSPMDEKVELLSSDRPNILVLPFETLGSQQDEYIGQGITDTLINSLLGFEQLIVQPTLTSKYIIENKLSKEDMAKTYGIGYVVDGKIQIQNKNMRLTTQLTDIIKNEVIWSNKFDFPTNNLFEVQDKLAEEILNNLSIKLTIGSAGQDGRKYFKTVENWRLWISARSDFIKATPEGFQRMGETTDKLMAIEPNNPNVLLLKGWHQYFSGNSKENAIKSYSYAKKAIEKGPDLADAYMLASFIELNNPFSIISADQKIANDLAEKRALKAAELDKTSPHNLGAIGNTLSGVGKVEEALNYYKAALEITPHAEAWIKYNYLNALVSIGQNENAKKIANEIAKADQFVIGAKMRALAVLAFIANKDGEKRKAQEFIFQINEMPHNDPNSKIDNIMWGFWNVKSNGTFIDEFKRTLLDLGLEQN